MAGYMALTFRDYSNELSTVRAHIPEYTAGNFVAQEALRTTLVAAIGALSIGNLAQSGYGNDARIGNTPATDPNAARERKFLVRYENTITRRVHHIEIPCADFSLTDLFPLQTDEVDLGQTEVAAFVDAFEALAVAPGTTNPVAVLKMTGVGRNL